jgi:hypothetical protein
MTSGLGGTSSNEITSHFRQYWSMFTSYLANDTQSLALFQKLVEIILQGAEG